MLNRSGWDARRQRGISMLLVLLVLVVLTLAAVGLSRSTHTANVIAGNLGFQRAATSSADRGVEAAVAWLENNSGQASSATAATCASSVGSTVLACDQAARGYLALRQDPGSSQSWSDLWDALRNAGTTPVELSNDGADNSVAYVIQRMCSSRGDPAASACSTMPTAVECGNSMTLGGNGGGGNLNCATQVYYRITVKVSGPRNTVSYTQAMVAL